MITKVEDALSIAHYFIIIDFSGPYGDVGSFYPIKVTHDESKKVWIVVCKFKSKGIEQSARVEIDATSGFIKGYELI